MTARQDRLPPELSGLAAWIACIADARPLDEVADLLASVGLVVESAAAHDAALGEMVERVEARLVAARILGGPVAVLGDRLDEALAIARAAKEAVAAGDLGYGAIVARRR
jgi:hypothetical protein